jgi:pimeloyl-ACP methyl ester carboxylesterase
LYAPHIAAQCDARAIAVFGSGIDTWTEYLDALTRRRMLMQGASEASVERAVRAQQALYATVHIRGETVAQAVARRPWIEEFRSMLGFDVERNAIDGRPARFWREVYEQRTAEELAASQRPLLALWGEQDWLTTREEHQRIASVSTRGTFVSLPETDHGYAAHDSALSSLRGPAGPYSPRAAQALIAWISTLA